MDEEEIVIRYVSPKEFKHRCRICGSYIKYRNNFAQHRRSQKHLDAMYVQSGVLEVIQDSDEKCSSVPKNCLLLK